ncbi:MAG: SpoIIIAH-like family protein [Clostridiales bacterium]|nr:SpoIIIAH-like family protein [Clostridiales bacterium]
MAQETKTKKNRGKLVLSLSVLVLGGALFLNWYFTNNSLMETLRPLRSSETTPEAKNLGEATYVGATTTEEESVSREESEYFSTARMDRQSARDEALEELNKVLDNDSAGDEAQKVAAEQIALISEFITIENKIETLVKAKDVENCLALVDEERVEVIVQCEELSEMLILQIREIVMNQTSVGYENISIIEVNT